MSPSTKVFLSILSILFAFAASTNAQTGKPTPTPEDEPERVFTEEIKLNVSAFDENGKFVSEIKKEDLVIIEDGRLHQASSVRRVPANVLIVMDTGGEMRQAKSFNQTRAAAKALINALQPQDSVSVMQYHDKVEIIAEWTSREDAAKIINGKANFGRRSMFVGAIATATKFLQKTPLDNRHLVLITDGTDTLNNQTERKAALENLLATDINVHVLSYTKLELIDIEPRAKGISTSPRRSTLPAEVRATLPNGVRDAVPASGGVTINTDRAFLKKMRERQTALLEAEKYLAALASDTNGGFILPESNEEMIDKTALVAQIIDSSYVVTYAPKRALKESPTGETRTIEVSSKRAGLLVQARRRLIVSAAVKQ